MRVPWLADVLRAAGCKVEEVPGWKGRGRDLVSVEGVVWHHTASGPSASDAQVATLLRVGRSDLPGPLCQLGLQRDGTFVVVADGKGNHNGYGTWGNQSIGIEAYNSGLGEPWPQVQLDAYDRGTAAILKRLGLGAERVKGHKETDPNRKIDPAGISMPSARFRINRLIYHPTPKPAEDDDMFTDEDRKKLNALYEDYGVKGKGVRQVIAEIAQRTKDLVSGNRG